MVYASQVISSAPLADDAALQKSAEQAVGKGGAKAGLTAEGIPVYRDSISGGEVYDAGFRNFLTMCWLQGKGKVEGEEGQYKVVVLRQEAEQNRVLTVKMAGDGASMKDKSDCLDGAFQAGWVKNEGSVVHSTQLAQWLDPAAIASSAVDLNIKLIKWRLVPELVPENIQGLKFLMLGSGTLGCSIARNLLGWGVRHITFLDSGVVNYSNPVRQSLFTHSDAKLKRPKAVAAAERARDVMPDLQGDVVELEIPMPGHPHSYKQENVDRLKQLIAEHDVVCMLTDSRESRWLPSLLVAEATMDSKGKGKTGPLAVTVALGFDSFVVMTHSCGSAKRACYFCNDVSAPTDSIKERTLDKQCTVVRPGVSGWSAAVAVELVASLSQHPDRWEAKPKAGESILGEVPDQIRGYLSNYRLAPMETEPFAHCVCCSQSIMETYRRDGNDFLKRVMENNSILEEVSGLNGMKQKVDDAIGDLELDEEDEDLCLL